MMSTEQGLHDIASPWLRMSMSLLLCLFAARPLASACDTAAICSCIVQLLATTSLGPSCFIKKTQTEADRHTCA